MKKKMHEVLLIWDPIVDLQLSINVQQNNNFVNRFEHCNAYYVKTKYISIYFVEKAQMMSLPLCYNLIKECTFFCNGEEQKFEY